MASFFPENRTRGGILINALIAAVSLFVNGFGIYLTIRAGIGSAPWDVFNLGLSRTFGILYGTASIAVSLCILGIDLLMREPIGLSMLIDSVVVGKSVDLFNYLDLVSVPSSLLISVPMLIAGLFIIGYTQYFYMRAALGCGPRDTLIVGLKKRLHRLPIGIVSVALTSVVTLIGWLLGGPVGIGTLLCAFGAGPIMQFAFFTFRFDAASTKHQNIIESLRIIAGLKRKSNIDGGKE